MYAMYESSGPQLLPAWEHLTNDERDRWNRATYAICEELSGDGYDDGYEDGYEVGMSSAANKTKAPL